MNVQTDLEEEEFRATKYPNLRVATGGKGPPEGPVSSFNWLAELEVGTVFWCRSNDKTVDWEEYFLIAKVDKDSYLLKMSVPDGKVWDRRVEPRLFSNQHREYKVVFVHPQQQEEENGSSG